MKLFSFLQFGVLFLGFMLLTQLPVASYTPPTNSPGIGDCQAYCDTNGDQACMAWCYYDANPRQCNDPMPSQCGNAGPDCCDCMAYCGRICDPRGTCLTKGLQSK